MWSPICEILNPYEATKQAIEKEMQENCACVGGNRIKSFRKLVSLFNSKHNMY